MRSGGPELQHFAHWPVRAIYTDALLGPARQVSAYLQRHPSPTPLRLSVHEGMEVGVLLAGRHEIQIADHQITLAPGDVWFVGMWEPHRWRALAGRTRMVGILFLPEFMPDEVLSGGLWQRMFTCPPSQRPRISDPEMRAAALNIGRGLERERELQPQHWETALRLGLAQLLLMLGRTWRFPHESRAPSSPVPPYRRVMPALAAVHTRPAAPITVAEAAARCRLSVPQFTRVFAGATGLGFTQFRIRARLALAAQLLLGSDSPIEAIAERSGFVDASHLHRHFVRHYGATPGDFRAENR